MVKSRVPVCLLGAALGAGFTLASPCCVPSLSVGVLAQPELLSDLGNQIENPFGPPSTM